MPVPGRRLRIRQVSIRHHISATLRNQTDKRHLRADNGSHWRGLDDLGAARCAWVSWFNEERLHGELGAARRSKSGPTIVTSLSLEWPKNFRFQSDLH